MKQLLLGFSILLMLVPVQWRSLQRASRATRFVYYGVFAVSLALWVYTGSHPTAVRPTEWIRHLLRAVDPLQ